MIRKTTFLLISALLSAGLMISISAIAILMGGASLRTAKNQERTVVVEKTELTPPPRQQRQQRQQPRRRPQNQPLRSAPRFAMDLGVEGGAGVAVPLDLTQRSRAGSGAGGDEGVDFRPELASALDFSLPASIRDAERNAALRLMFCVDASGRPYNIRVTEESPSGMGLAQAGTEALAKAVFKPAMREGQAVPFCGMEQPIEIRFRN